MIYDTARELARELSASDEYKAYKKAKETAFENETTRSLVKEYRQLQYKAQAALIAGQKDEETMERMQKLGEVLQLNPTASEFLLAEYRLNRMVSDVYKLLADAIDIDLGLEG